MPSLAVSRLSCMPVVQRWLAMIQTVLDGRTVLPSEASTYLTGSIGVYMMRLVYTSAQFIEAAGEFSDTNYHHKRNRLEYNFPGLGLGDATAILLAYILHGGYMETSFRLIPLSHGGFYNQGCELEVVSNTSSYNQPISMSGCPKTFLLAPTVGGVCQTLWLQDLAEMLLSGRTLAKLRELIDERRKYADLEDSQACLRVRDKFGTALQICHECQNFQEEDTYWDVLTEWRSKLREDPSWKPPAWESRGR